MQTLIALQEQAIVGLKASINYAENNNLTNTQEFINFLDKIKFINKDFDIMIEAKAKDEALFKLVRELKYKTNYKYIDETTFII